MLSERRSLIRAGKSLKGFNGLSYLLELKNGTLEGVDFECFSIGSTASLEHVASFAKTWDVGVLGLELSGGLVLVLVVCLESRYLQRRGTCIEPSERTDRGGLRGQKGTSELLP
jgi:hypothetical protein